MSDPFHAVIPEVVPAVRHRASARPPAIHILATAALLPLIAGCATADLPAATSSIQLATATPATATLAVTPRPTAPVAAILKLSAAKYQTSVVIGQVAQMKFTLTNTGNEATGPLWVWLRPTAIEAIVRVRSVSPLAGAKSWHDDDIGSPEYSSSAIMFPSLEAGASRKYGIGLEINDLGSPVTVVLAIGPGPTVSGDGIVFDHAWAATRDLLDLEVTIDAHF